jgi:hypothetical protein
MVAKGGSKVVGIDDPSGRERPRDAPVGREAPENLNAIGQAVQPDIPYPSIAPPAHSQLSHAVAEISPARRSVLPADGLMSQGTTQRLQVFSGMPSWRIGDL